MPKETLIRGESSCATFAKEGQINPHGLIRVHKVLSDGEPYYLKFPRYPEDRSSHQKLKREYEMHSALSHPNITPVVLFDTTKDLIPGFAVPFFIMPQCET